MGGLFQGDKRSFAFTLQTRICGKACISPRVYWTQNEVSFGLTTYSIGTTGCTRDPSWLLQFLHAPHRTTTTIKAIYAIRQGFVRSRFILHQSYSVYMVSYRLLLWSTAFEVRYTCVH